MAKDKSSFNIFEYELELENELQLLEDSEDTAIDTSYGGASILDSLESDAEPVEDTTEVVKPSAKKLKSIFKKKTKDAPSLTVENIYMSPDSEQHSESITLTQTEEAVAEAKPDVNATEDISNAENSDFSNANDFSANESGQQFFIEPLLDEEVNEKSSEAAVNEVPSENFIDEHQLTFEDVENSVPETFEASDTTESITEKATENSDFTVHDFTVEPVISANDEVDSAAKLLESTDVSINDEINDDAPQTPLLEYKDIKNKINLENFETPYVYYGKNGAHMRFRISSQSDRDVRKARIIKNIIEYSITIVAALIIGLLIHFYVFTLAIVDGSSMVPTLHNNERLFVTRYDYHFGDIQRGDVVITKYPSHRFPEKYVKRVIAVAGDTIEISKGVVYINDAPITEDYISAPCPNDFPKTVIPEGKVFVMGDNRPDSADSRMSEIGPFSTDLIIGKAKYIIFPRFVAIED